MAAQKQGRGCFFYGTITMILVIVGVLLGVYFGSRKAIQAVVAKYTAPSPVPVPRLALTPAEEERIARNLARTAQQAAQGQGPGELSLGEQELNVLLYQAPDLKIFREQIYLQPEGDKLKAQMSVPLDQFEHWKALGRKIGGNLTNRYLNGTAFLAVGITNGQLNLNITDLVVNGENLPSEFVTRVQGQNFAKDATNNAEFQAALQKVESITVTNGKVQVQFKK